MPPHLNPQGERKEKKIIENPLSLEGGVWVRVKLNHIWKPIPSNRIAINLVLPLIRQAQRVWGYWVVGTCR